MATHQYSCLENPMDGGAWWAAVHGVAKSQTRLKWLSSSSSSSITLHQLEWLSPKNPQTINAREDVERRTPHTESVQFSRSVMSNSLRPHELQHTRPPCGEGNGIPLQYSCLENPMDGGAWWAAVHEVSKSRTQLSDFTFTFHFHALEKEMATYSSVLAWRIPGMGEPGGLPSMGSHDWSDLTAGLKSLLLNQNLFCFVLNSLVDSNGQAG